MRRLPSGYVHGPEAATEATARALAALDDPRSIVLVEGVTDQIALETLAAVSGVDLTERHVAVLPIGGAQAVRRFLDLFAGADARIVGLCDAGEAPVWRRALARAGLGTPETREDMAALGFHTCVDDLEDELLRAVGADRVQEILGSAGDLRSFRTLQRQNEWRDRPVHAQLRRFVAAGARRKHRYAWLLTQAAADLDRSPAPLVGVLGAATT